MSDTGGRHQRPQGLGHQPRASAQRVAVLDTGVLPHADIVANLLPGYDMITDSEPRQRWRRPRQQCQRPRRLGGRRRVRLLTIPPPGQRLARHPCGWHHRRRGQQQRFGYHRRSPQNQDRARAGAGQMRRRRVSDIADGIVWAVGGQGGQSAAQPPTRCASSICRLGHERAQLQQHCTRTPSTTPPQPQGPDRGGGWQRQAQDVSEPGTGQLQQASWPWPPPTSSGSEGRLLQLW